MQPTVVVRIGLVADPAAPTEVAERLHDLENPERDGPAWDVEVVSEPFALESEDVDAAVARLGECASERGWDLVVGLTELPLRDDDGHYLLVEADDERRTAVLSLPALGGVKVHARTRAALRQLLAGMADPGSTERHRVPLARRGGRGRLLLGMVLANRPWRLVPGMKSALVAALATGAIATINSSVWVLAGSMPGWRLTVATLASIALVVGWVIVDGGLWDRPDDQSQGARERSRLYNASTLLTLGIGVTLCYVALYLVNLAWAWFVLDPVVMSRTAGQRMGGGDLLGLAWFVASAATVGGALGTGLESDEAIRAAAYSKREEVRRERLARE